MWNDEHESAFRIAVIGTGSAGVVSDWLHSHRHDMTVCEEDDRQGGHSNAIKFECVRGPLDVDTGFTVSYKCSYSNSHARFNDLHVLTHSTDMAFAASLDFGKLKYSGPGNGVLLAQPNNVFRPRLWRMLRGIFKSEMEAPVNVRGPNAAEMSLGDYVHLQQCFASLCADTPDDPQVDIRYSLGGIQVVA